MQIQIKNTDNLVVSSLKCLVYGAAGIGKTRFCATAPNPIILSTEPGLLSLREQSIPYINISSHGELLTAYEELKNDSTYSTICIDSLSELAEVLLNNYKPAYQDRRQAYGQMADEVLDMIRKFRDLPDKHVIFTCKESIRDDEIAKTSRIQPGFPGLVLPSNVPYLLDNIFYLTIQKKGKDESLLAQTKSSFKILCKDRTGKLLPMEEPDFSAILEKVKQ